MKGLRNWGKYCASENCCIRSLDPSAFCPTTRLTLDSPIPNDYPVNYIYEWIGYNLKPLDLQSAMLSSQLDMLPEYNRRRRRNYELLFEYFERSKFSFKIWKLDGDVSPFSFPLIIPDNAPFIRKHLVDHLKRNKVETRVIFGGNLMRHPAYYKESLCVAHGNLNNSNIIMERGLMLGVSHINDEKTTQKMIDIINSFLTKF
jgi:CDP-6-deoxy-D-xylo-4-hexulose-3-dehydrase